MVSMLAWSAIDLGFEPRSRQTKDYIICICCFSAMNALLRRKSKDGLAQNKNNISEWSDMCTVDCCFSDASSIKITLTLLL